MKPPAPDRNRGDLTRDALILAAMTVFGRDGFHATTTRAIAEEAKVNQALIGYHFGGKEGLYLAMFEHIAGQLGQRLGPRVDAIGRLLETPAGADEAVLRGQAEEALVGLAEGMLMLMTRPEYAAWAQLVLREQQSPTQAFEILYERFMGRVLALLEQLVRRLRGESAGEFSIPGEEKAEQMFRHLLAVNTRGGSDDDGQILRFPYLLEPVRSRVPELKPFDGWPSQKQACGKISRHDLDCFEIYLYFRLARSHEHFTPFARVAYPFNCVLRNAIRRQS